eukprot:jgi/Psemu1/68665/estExt_Genemark1.C_5610003
MTRHEWHASATLRHTSHIIAPGVGNQGFTVFSENFGGCRNTVGAWVVSGVRAIQYQTTRNADRTEPSDVVCGLKKITTSREVEMTVTGSKSILEKSLLVFRERNERIEPESSPNGGSGSSSSIGWINERKIIFYDEEFSKNYIHLYYYCYDY